MADYVFEVFIPNDVPRKTYVSRHTSNNEEKFRDSLQTPNMSISISGPSKTGKTALVNRCVDGDDVILVSGASIKSDEALWKAVMRWIGGPDEIAKIESKSKGVGSQIRGKGELNALVAKGQAEVGASFDTIRETGTVETYVTDYVEAVVRELAGSEYLIFIDDFHYIPAEKQKEIARSIKAVSERGVRVCVASVPHRSDDVVRANDELSGRLISIDFDYWNEADLSKIADQGFDELEVDIAPGIIRRLAKESLGSPQLMQSLCLNLCLETNIRNKMGENVRRDISDLDFKKALERTAQQSDYSSIVDKLHAGAKQRGTQRKEFSLKDNSTGDVYRAILLALVSDPPKLNFTYDEITQRVRNVCRTDSPTGSSVNESLSQMAGIASDFAKGDVPILEWEEENLEINNPYFMFYLRASNRLQMIYHRKTGITR
jgi:AAA+ ATPase superfamily predicted ATPase